MEILDRRRRRLLSMIWSRLRYVFYYIRTFQFKAAYVYLWTSMFTRDAGLGLADWIYRINPFWAPHPQTMEVEVTTRCHLKCLICEHTYWNEPARDMSFDEFKHVVDQFPKLKWIGLTGIGSSFLNKDFMKILRYLKERHVFIEFYDHFDLINRDIAEELIRIGVDKIWVSMDAATKETYEKIRPGANFDKSIENIRTMFKLKEELRSPSPEIWFHYIVNTENMKEMGDYVDLVNSIVPRNNTNYATLIYFTALLQFKEVLHLFPKIPAELRDSVIAKANKYGLYINWNENVTCDKYIRDCTKWVEPFVLVTGHVQPCCAINMANDRNFQKENAWGNLFTEDFKDIWNSEKVKSFKKMIHNNKQPKVCKNCRIYRV
ncbi:MAG: radical SAM protein [Endomicrobiales bacterium]|nr:radical SAM protein [Endomicrobiales bacterium]